MKSIGKGSKINSIPQLLKILDGCDGLEYKKVVNQIDIPLSAFKPFTYWEKDSYTRNCIHRTDDYELILICWDRDSETSIHCHNNQECWVYILEGEFQENRYHDHNKGLQKDRELELTMEGISYMNDDMGYHKLINSTAKRAMSLHLYMNPINECRVYDPEQGIFKERVLEYFSFEGEEI